MVFVFYYFKYNSYHAIKLFMTPEIVFLLFVLLEKLILVISLFLSFKLLSIYLLLIVIDLSSLILDI